ncbi:hypothetical protein HPB50_003029 [Hyalomma asiaticum]|uniref:Uncharacterized protein n=1 Tax=Hyalomma asiaticum TaxID=266040 RepID=A0ACB7SDK0_HYAAI|nr:hypothetical protein HPB50_003029 [Hyalomma asiaticum]
MMREAYPGGLAVAVPGELRGYEELHRRYGKLNWSELFDDAIQLATKGFHIGAELANALKAGEKYTSSFANKTRQAFLNSHGKVLQKGDKLVQKDLAETLKAIAANGADYFYEGDLAKEIVQEVQENGKLQLPKWHSGVIIASDLANYSVSWVTPLNRTLKGNLTVFTTPPPGSGGIVSFVLGIMDAFRTTAEECLPENVTTFHRFAESCKFGYAKRALLGDVDFENCSKVLDEMTSKEEAEKVMRNINDTHTLSNLSSYGFVHQYARHDAGNSHATFWNRSDMIITISSTINHPFGSWIRTNSGVLLNNQMDSFSTPDELKRSGQQPASANFIKPKKRPMSSMAPTVIVDHDGTGLLALGGTGGSLLASGIALV